MSLTVACPACRKQYRIDESRYGRKLKCQCGEVFRAPTAPGPEPLDLSSASQFAKPEPIPQQLVATATDVSAANLDNPKSLPPVVSTSGAAKSEFGNDDDLKLGPSSTLTRFASPLPNPAINPQAKFASSATKSPKVKPADKPQKSCTYFGIENNFAFKAGQTLTWVGFLGLILPHMGMQLVMLSLSGSPYQVHVMSIASMVVGAILIFFSQGKDFIRGGAMALFAVVLLGGTLGLEHLWAEGLIEEPKPRFAIQSQIQSPAPRVSPSQIQPRPIRPPQFGQAPSPDITHHSPSPIPQPEQFRPHFGENTHSEADTLPRTNRVGGPGGGPFTAIDAQHQPVLGFYWRTEDWDGNPTIAELTPVYSADDAFQDGHLVLAKEGYAVGGMIVSADQYVRGVQIVFMRLDGDRLSSRDKYVSDWVGTQAGRSTVTLGANGTKVLGLFGQKGVVMDSVGLILSGR